MQLVAYTQYYRCKTADRQREIDECLRHNLNHPGIRKLVLFKESDAPPLPQATVDLEVVESNTRITYAEWFRWVKRQGSGIALLLNADLYLDEGLEHLAATFDTPETFLALTRYNPGHAGFHLNDYPHWTQDVWGVRADAELPESLLYASGFPLGFPGCDNRIAYVMWSHGFRVRNPCYHVRSVHLQASAGRHYDKTSDRLYGGVSYVHPSLAPDEDAELEFTLWTRSQQRPPGVLVNQQAIEQGVHQLRHGEAEVAQRFLDQQQFTGLSWVHEAVGSAHLEGNLHRFASEDTVFLPMPALLAEGVELRLPQPTRLEGLSMRLPRRAPAGYRLELRAEADNQACVDLRGDSPRELKPGGERRFWQPAELNAEPWQHLRLKLQGPAVDPAWQHEEGAELVLFGSEGSLDQAKSLNVIAEAPQPSQKGTTNIPPSAAKQERIVLSTMRFAEQEKLDAKNLGIEHSATNTPDGTGTGDRIFGSSADSIVKYAFNTYDTTNPGTYTASLILKAGSQSKVVLRINDQTGVNDARQAFDLQVGRKLGAAVNGGSATDAHGEIEPVGDGWHQCSITATFHEPVECLHAPSLWFEHYAPSASVDHLFTGQAEILQQNHQEAVQPEPADNATTNGLLQAPVSDGYVGEMPPTAEGVAYSWRRRNDCSALLEQGEELHRYGSRFRVLRCGDELVFDDRFWPSVGVSPLAELPCELGDRQGLLLWGFGQPTLELRPGFIANTKRFSADVNFWQYPCRTEGDAFAVHQSLVGPQVRDGTLQLYLGLPWATWIDRQSWPTSTLRATADRLRKLRQALGELGLGLKVHSVCQHIRWRENLHLIKASGVECLWLSHKPQAEDQLEGVELRAWHLYAVNAREADRRTSLWIKPPATKPWLATFVGAHMDHYITDVRPKLLQFKDLHRFHIALKEEWHFNPIVYGEQVEDNLFWDRSTKVVEEDVLRYNRILSDTVFSLCPGGAGPNSLRLWESLAVGSIPVILSDQLVLPDLAEISGGRWSNWDDIVIRHPEAELDTLPERLEAINAEEIEQRSAAGLALMEQVNRFTCLGARSDRALEPVQQETEPDERKPLIVIPVYGPTDRYYWRQKKHGFYDVVLEWYLRGKVRIRFGDKGYFWWGGEGEILLMERDLVIDLHDKKVDPPRWEGEVAYKHAFFFNQYHIENSRNHKATYFTYSPPELEKVRQALGRKAWSERKHASIYAGSIENEAQEFFRNRFSGWDEEIEIYALTDRLRKNESYRYSINEYLSLVSLSRYGVCFRGNGPKCFREIEYLSLGTPLIITPGVEVNYPTPLEEGVHFFRACSRDDIRRITRDTSPEKWDAMSKACWDWFEEYGTIDKLFSHLLIQIQQLTQATFHQCVRILAPNHATSDSLAAKSLRIFSPKAKVFSHLDHGECLLELSAEDLVINELPALGQEGLHRWRVSPAEQRRYCESILESELEAHKQVLELMRLRARNFRISLYGSQGSIPLWDRITDKGIYLNSDEEKARLTADYDFLRNCKGPYLAVEREIKGPGLIELCVIQAILVYTRNGHDYSADLSPHFNDYYTMNQVLIPEDSVYHTCKLWRFTECAFGPISIKILQGTENVIGSSIYYPPFCAERKS